MSEGWKDLWYFVQQLAIIFGFILAFVLFLAGVAWVFG